MKVFSLALCLILSLFLVACTQPLDDDKTHYVGSWMSADSSVTIVISPEGRIEYNNKQPRKSASLSAPIQSFQGDSFKAGIGPFSTEFKVTQAPTQDAQGNWFMVIDGYTLAKRS